MAGSSHPFPILQDIFELSPPKYKREMLNYTIGTLIKYNAVSKNDIAECRTLINAAVTEGEFEYAKRYINVVIRRNL